MISNDDTSLSEMMDDISRKHVTSDESTCKEQISKLCYNDYDQHICSPDIRNVSTLEVLHNHALQTDIYLITYQGGVTINLFSGMFSPIPFLFPFPLSFPASKLPLKSS